jgi:hypothetical protein
MPHNPKESESDLIDHVVILFAEWWENGHPNQPKKEIIKKKKKRINPRTQSVFAII